MFGLGVGIQVLHHLNTTFLAKSLCIQFEALNSGRTRVKTQGEFSLTRNVDTETDSNPAMNVDSEGFYESRQLDGPECSRPWWGC